MPTLNWIGKDKVVNHAAAIPFHILKHVYNFGGASENKIIHGDNLLALKSLLPEYERRVKCIYIDPPYNTGNEGWIYNDKVNSPQIKKWLGEVVGKEGEDLSRHDKWLCMMYPRLKLLKKLLADDGAIFISIDDNEQANLKLICDEIFGAQNFVEIFSWKKTETPANLAAKTKKAIEYVICYMKSNTPIKFRGLSKVSKSNNGLMNQTNAEKELVFPANCADTSLPDGIYRAKEYGTKSYKILLLEDTEVKNGRFIKPVKLYGKFKWSQENLNRELERNTKISIKTIAFSPSYEKLEYAPEVPWNIIDKSFGVQTNEMASAELRNIFDGKKIFDFPKPPSLIEYLINFLCDKNSIVLDSFAGSGTTAHAVLNLNAHDGGNRKFILVEMEDYADTITAERVRRVIKGYEQTVGTGGSFDFYEIGEPLMIQGNLNENIDIEKIRTYIWYTETRTPYKKPSSNNSAYLGDFNGTAYYFHYERDWRTTLDAAFLRSIEQHADKYLIYADECGLDEDFLQRNSIIFKKIPRDIKKIWSDDL